MKAITPKFGAYAVSYNIKSSNYPWKECVLNALEYCDKFYILDGHSNDGSWEQLQETFGENPNVVLVKSKDAWDMSVSNIVGQKKQEARELVQEDYCVYLDLDEILKVKDKSNLLDMVLNNSRAEVFSIPYITFFGSPYQVGNFKDAENFWRWKIFINRPHIGHGIHGKARKYDKDGCLYLDKTISDGCELINLQTLEVMSSLMYMPVPYAQAGQKYREVPTDVELKKKIGLVFSETINDFAIVCLHYGWTDFENKARNGLEYWTKTKAYKDGDVEHSRLFDGLDSNAEETYLSLVGSSYIQTKVDEWNKIDTIQLRIREHPEVIRPFLAKQLKPKVLNVALTSGGPFGVPKWGLQLTDALSQYDVQHFAFADYNTIAPPQAKEFHKAESMIKHIQGSNSDKDALVVFGDGFWASTYTGPAKVISVVHGLWHHPMREKWGDDGLIEQRKELFRYQLSYFKQAKSLGHTLVCVSPFIAKILKDEHDIDTIVIPNAVDLDFYDKINITALEKDKPLILHGITSANKGLDIIKDIENHPLIKDRFDIGSIDEISAHAQVPKAVTFKAADVAFLPTKWEASSYLLLECLANNLPIAAHRAGILNCDNLHRRDNIGVITDDYDVDTFAKAIVEAYENREHYMCGRLFLQENKMTINDWNESIKKLIYEVL